MQRCAQIRRLDRRYISHDRIKIVLGHFDRDNRRRQNGAKGLGDAFDLGKAGMRVEHIESGETILPVAKTAHHGKGWRLPHSLHPIGMVNHMAPSTMRQRQVFARDRVTVIADRGLDRLFGDSRKDGCAVDPESCNRAFPNIRHQPAGKKRGAFRAVVGQMPDPIHRLEDRDTSVADLCITAAANLCHPHPVLERETRQQIIQKTRLYDFVWRRQGKTAILRQDLHWYGDQRQQAQNQPHKPFHIHHPTPALAPA